MPETPIELLRSPRVARDDQACLEAWQAGDDAAGGELVRRHWPGVVRFFLATTGGDRVAAEDLAQDTFLTVVRQRDAIATSYRAYCFGVARMKRFEAARSRRARARVVGDDDALADFPDQVSEAERARARLAITVLRRLEPDEQLLIILKDYLGFTQPELAETFKVTQGRIAGRLTRARRRFRREFEAMELAPDDRERTLRSLDTALASMVARFPDGLAARLAEARR